ncbi:hypothetical protein KFE25_005687 [Diacronema lutheri]|uniref:AB hydrolase-1 domain-containing protein n=1 Tax=Diacronema lutheri TaxID=2081491 RepID=A0A8J5X2G8_DIALT|nr:hypothetical protein KFE25_005687 [Diacronema lutheri]
MTAHRLRRRYGHSVLLLDWLHHGRSGSPASASALSASALLAQLRASLEHVGWTGADHADGRLTLAGCSLGGALAMLYTSAFDADVDRLVLVAPAGFDEPWHRLSHAGRVAARALVRATAAVGAAPRARGTPLGRLVAHAHLISDTPRYGNARDWFDTAAARRKPTLLVCAAFDELHRADAWARCRADDRTFRLRTLAVNHALLCQHLDCLRLDLDAAAWHAEGAAEPHSRL